MNTTGERLTAERARSRLRHRRALASAASSLASRGVGLIVSLLTVPLTIGYLGAERYGLWLTIGSLVALLGAVDLGIGHSLMTELARADGLGNSERAQKLVSSAIAAVLIIALIGGSIFSIVAPQLDWAGILNATSTQARSEALPAVAIGVACFLFSLPLGVGQRIQQAYQRGYRASVWQAFGSVLTLAMVVVAIRAEAGLPVLVLAIAGPSVVALVANSVDVFCFDLPQLRPRGSRVSVEHVRELIRTGSWFFAVQVAGIVAFSTDNLVLAHVVGPTAVAEYGVPYRLTAVALTLMSMTLAPLWPAYAEALARGDTSWARRTLRGTLSAAVVAGLLVGGVLVWFGSEIIQIWVGDSISVREPLFVGLSIWFVLSACGSAIAVYMNGANLIRVQARAAVLMAVVNLPLSIVLARRFGVTGPIWGTIISYTCISLVPLTIYVARHSKRLSEAKVI